MRDGPLLARGAHRRASLARRTPRARALLLVAAGIVVLAACSRTYVLADRGTQSFYQTSPPIRDTSADIERIFRAVKRIQVTGVYRTHRFALADSVTTADLRNAATYRRATENYTFTHSKAGTATVIAAGPRGVTLITNEHVARLPDTVIVHYPDPAAPPRTRARERYVESVAVLTDRSDFVHELRGVRPFAVIARDSLNDIAALQVDMPAGELVTGIDVLQATRGDPGRLSWASFVYVLGYPAGYRMVTRAIVSDPGRTGDSFLLDGLFNRGISGGLILAVRAETGALEWVGLATSASAETEYVLFPEDRVIEEEGMLLPYSGPLYLERTGRINYGITFSVPLTAVEEFLRRHRLTPVPPPAG